MNKQTIGFIGQGWIGKNYADNLEERGYDVIRYALEEPFAQNKDKINDCDIVFIAVPTPTTIDGFNCDTLKNVVGLVGEGKIAVIKSTVLPNTTEEIQEMYPDIFVLHSPEFLTEKTAKYDTDFPARNIIGIPIKETDEMYNIDNWKNAAKEVMKILPEAPCVTICSSRESAMIKYIGNCYFFVKNVFFNMMYDLSESIDCNYEKVRQGVIGDPRIDAVHTSPVHKSGRGAGGHCLPKDFEALRRLMKETDIDTGIDQKLMTDIFKDLIKLNNEYLIKSGKDIDIVREIYNGS